ncbi:MAG: hypothetical protein ACR2JC_04460 [Chloroflexota bacterium]
MRRMSVFRSTVDEERPPDADQADQDRERKYQEECRLQEQGVEDSFPASDPPSANVFD